MSKVFHTGGSKKVRFRAKVSKAGNKIHIIVPQFYHKDIIDNDFLGAVVQVQVSEIKTSGSIGDIDFD